MTISLPHGLSPGPALSAEGVAAISDQQATGVRPLRIGLLNLMPDKIATERQFTRVLAAAARPVELILMRPASHRPRNTPEAHIATFYRTFDEIRQSGLDGLIVTGAPVETLDFEEVRYWRELCDIIDWANACVGASLYVCWAAQAALHHNWQVPKHQLPRKLFGVYDQDVLAPDSALVDGLGPAFPAPVSRHTEVRAADLPAAGGLRVLAASPASGLCLVEDAAIRAHYMFNHLEYDAGTLAAEHARDRARGIELPPWRALAPDAAPAWTRAAQIFFSNWIARVAAATV